MKKSPSSTEADKKNKHNFGVKLIVGRSVKLRSDEKMIADSFDEDLALVKQKYKFFGMKSKTFLKKKRQTKNAVHSWSK
jgi:hypothetical protein